MERRIDDLGLARSVGQSGLAGFVLKSHYAPTAERASVVRAAAPGTGVLGAITLNLSVGGLNPADRGDPPRVHLAAAHRRRSARARRARRHLEHCFTTPHTGKCTWEQVFSCIPAAGPGQSFFPATWDSRSIRRWNTAWPSWPTGSSPPGSVRRRYARWRSPTPACWRPGHVKRERQARREGARTGGQPCTPEAEAPGAAGLAGG